MPRQLPFVIGLQLPIMIIKCYFFIIRNPKLFSRNRETFWGQNILRADWKRTLVLAVSLPCSSLPIFADSSFSLTSKASGLCIIKKSNRCFDVRWTTGDQIFVTLTRKCLGAQGKSLGSEVNFYDCDDKSELQKWECKNETLLALKGQKLYIEVKPDDTLSLSRTVGPNNHLTVTGTTRGACSKTYRGTVQTHEKQNRGIKLLLKNIFYLWRTIVHNVQM